MTHFWLSMRSLMACIFLCGIASCAAPARVHAPAANDVASTLPGQTTQGPGRPAVQIEVERPLQEGVRRAIQDHSRLAVFGFEGELPQVSDYRLVLSFGFRVDKHIQIRMQNGAVVSPAGGLFGAMIPWSCPTTYTIDAVISRSDGLQLASYSAHKEEKRIGTMMWCPEDAPASVVAELTGEVLGRVEADKILERPAEDTRPAPTVGQ